MTQARWWTGSLALAVCCSFWLVATAEEKAKETQEVEARDLKLVVPKAWKQEEPSSRFRVAQFKIAAAEGDKEAAELVITQFGGGGGPVNDNLKRWVNQFQGKDRKVKITKGKCPQGEYYLVDATGIYNRPDGPPIAGKTVPVAGQRMLAIMLLIEDKGSYFLKLNGSEKTVAGVADDLRAAISAKASDEKEHKTE